MVLPDCDIQPPAYIMGNVKAFEIDPFAAGSCLYWPGKLSIDPLPEVPNTVSSLYVPESDVLDCVTPEPELDLQPE